MKEEEKILYEATCLFLIRNGQVLLAMKMKKIGKGKWNGYGGGIEAGETERQACVREMKEESGGVIVDEKDLLKVADAYFHNNPEDKPPFTLHMAVFFAYKWQGVPITTDEMSNPTWFDFEKIPVDQMIPGDAKWLPVVLSGKKIRTEMKYGPHQAYLIGDVKIEEV